MMNVNHAAVGMCTAEPTMTKRDGLIYVECLGCGDRWVTPVIKTGGAS